MKKIIAVLLTALMLASCLSLMLVSVSAASAKTISYAPAAVVPTVDGQIDESVWASTNEFNDVKILWSDEGLYFATTKKDLVIKYNDVAGDPIKTITIAGGVVTLPTVTGAEYASDLAIEIFVPYTHAFEWEWYGFVQERVDGAPHATVDDKGQNIASAEDAITFDFLPKGIDLIGNMIQFAVNDNELAAYELVGPWGYTCLMGGKDTSGCGSYNLIWTGESVEGQSRTNILLAPTGDVTDQVEFGGAMWDISWIDLGTDGQPIPKSGWLPEQMAYAVRVTDETAPIIDGQIDSVWESTGKLYHLSHIYDPVKDAYGYISILWSEKGLYFLANIKDVNVTSDPAAVEFDHVNFNVSEYDIAQSTAAEDQTCAATVGNMNAAGSYSFGVGPTANHDGETGAFTEARLAGGMKFASNITATGYVVEAYVPYFKMTAADAKVGHMMSIQSSVDNFIPDQAGRAQYTNLGDQASYWSNPSSSYSVVFVDSYDVAVNSPSLRNVYDMVTGLLIPYLKSADAFGEADVTDIVEGYTDDLESSIDELNDALAALQAAAAEYATKADVAAIDVSAQLADYAKTSDVDAKIDAKVDDVKVKDYTAVVVILFVLVVLEIGATVFVVVKKK